MARHGDYDLAVAADGLHSSTRAMLFADAPMPVRAGQSVWRHNFPRPADVDALQAYEGPIGAGLVPLSATTMYMFVTTPEPPDTHMPQRGMAEAMRTRMAGLAPQLVALSAQIVDDAAVVYRPLETIFIDGPGIAAASCSSATRCMPPRRISGRALAWRSRMRSFWPKNCAGPKRPSQPFEAYRARRFERCRTIVELSLAVCRSQLGTGPAFDYGAASRSMFQTVSQPI